MKTERAPCEGAPPPTLPYIPSEGVKEAGAFADTSATESNQYLEYPKNVSYGCGIIDDLKPTKPKNDTYYRMCVVSYAAIDPRIKDGDIRILVMMLTLRQADGKMIVGHEKLSRLLGRAEKTMKRGVRRLEESEYLQCIEEGNGSGNAAIHILGGMFLREQAEWCKEQVKRATERGSQITPFSKEEIKKRGTILSQKGGRNLPPHTIDQPNNTHIKGVPSAFNKENWLKRGKETYPDWDDRDLNGAFYSAETKGVNSSWPSYQDKCYALRYKTQQPPPVVPKSWHKQAPKPQRAQCESPRLEPLDYNNLQTLESQIYTALKEGLSLTMIKANTEPKIYMKAFKRVQTLLKQ